MRRSSVMKMPIKRMSTKQTGRTIVLMGVMFIAGTMILNITSAAAQTTAITPGDPSDLRPLFINAGEILEGKRLANSACAACHGLNGISVTQGVPNLAGQRAPYLYLELKAYKSDARGDKTMHNATMFLNDDAMVKVAAYFASLDPAEPSVTAAPAKPDPLQAGKAATAACAGCHGEIGISKTPGMPSLVGLDPKYFVAAMQAYKNDQRKNPLMKSMVAAISDADLNNIALYYALVKPARAQTPSPGDQTRGKVAATACTGCHGDIGVSGSPTNPSLAGQDAQYLAVAMQAYKDGSRIDETMKSLVASLDNDAIRNIAAFYANQQPQPPNVRKPLTAQEWAQRCDRCHGLNGNSVDPRLPALAAQRMDYLVMVLKAYRLRVRRSSEMAAMSDALSESDIENLAAHYARQKARAVVYVTVPAK